MCKSIIKQEIGQCPECETFNLVLNHNNYVCKGGACDVCIDMFDVIDNRDLDYLVAKYIYHWKNTYVPPDYDGKNEGYILTETGKFHKDFQLPPKGKLHRAFMVLSYCENLERAIRLAKYVGLDLNSLELDARQITIKCLKSELKEII